MASAHILINGTGSAHNRQLRSFIDALWEVQQQSVRLKAVFDQAALGDDWVALAALLDILSVDDAEAIYNLLGSVNTELDGSFINQFISRLG